MIAGRRSATLVALSLSAVVLLAGFTAVAMASTTSSPAAAASPPAGLRRNVVWYGVPEAAPRALHIESTSVGAPVQDEFQITYATGNFTLVYQRTAGGPITTQFTMTIEGLAEWNDTGGDGNFGEGSVVAYTPLGPGAFGRYPIQHSSLVMPDNTTEDSFVIQSNKGDVSLNLTIADGFYRLPSDQNLTPMEAKLTVEINHTMALPNTRLSLQITISTDQKVVLENQSWDDLNDFSTDDRALNVTNQAGPNPSSAFFAWSNTAAVNGLRGDVVAAGPFANSTFPGSYDLYLTYPQQAPGTLQVRIDHDPTLGVVSAAYLSSLHPTPGSPIPFQGDAVLYAASLATIGVLVAGTALLVRRRRKAP